MKSILSSKRLNFREITKDDFQYLSPILQDIEIMYAWEHAFTAEEVRQWIDKNLERYQTDGFSYFAAIEKESREFIGVIGPLIEEIDGKKAVGIAYILDKKYWGKGYAIEGAKACMEYAFQNLNAEKVIAEIRPNNLPSCNVAEKLGMKVEGEFVKYYNHTYMPHLIYSIEK